MSTLKIRLVILIAWLFVFGNIERLHDPINIASFVYAYTVAIAVAFLMFRPLRNAPMSWTAVPMIALFFLVKSQLGYAIAGRSLPLTITELFGICVTIYLTRTLCKSIDVFEEAATRTLMVHIHDPSIPLEEGEHRLYQEMRRSRRFRRPVSLVSLIPSSQSLEISENAILEEIQREAAQKYLRARIAEVMKQELRDCDIIARQNGHFVLMLPEVNREEAKYVIERIQAVAENKLGVKLKTGISTFPQEEITLVGLVERAESEMNVLELPEAVKIS